MKRLRVLLRRARKDERGNVAVIFGLSLLTMVGLVGLGIDFSRAMATKSALDASADAAALAAVTEAMASLTSSNAVYANSSASAILTGTQAAQAVFMSNAAKTGSLIGGVPTPQISISQGGSNNKTLTAQVSYTATSPNMFGGMFGTGATALNGTATSSLVLPSFMNITVAIDNSQSMGLAATTAAQTQLQGLTNDNCAFGCHFKDTGTSQSQTNETTAHQNNIQLRIDVIKASTQSMINAAAAMPLSPSGAPQMTFSIATFDTGVTSVAKQSSAYSQLLTEAGNLDLGTDAASGDGDTNTQAITTWLNNVSNVPPSGDGTSPAKAQQYVFLMTDGVEDTYSPSATACVLSINNPLIAPQFAWNHCTSPFDWTQCAALKNAGVIVGVIYTTYLQMAGDNRWQTLVQPFSNQIGTNLSACASPGWYYQATQASDIQSAVNALFNQATGHGVLTR